MTEEELTEGVIHLQSNKEHITYPAFLKTDNTEPPTLFKETQPNQNLAIPPEIAIKIPSPNLPGPAAVAALCNGPPTPLQPEITITFVDTPKMFRLRNPPHQPYHRSNKNADRIKLTIDNGGEWNERHPAGTTRDHRCNLRTTQGQTPITLRKCKGNCTNSKTTLNDIPRGLDSHNPISYQKITLTQISGPYQSPATHRPPRVTQTTDNLIPLTPRGTKSYTVPKMRAGRNLTRHQRQKTTPIRE